MYSSCQFAAGLMGSINIAWFKQLDATFVLSSFTVLMLVTMQQEKRECRSSESKDTSSGSSRAWQLGVNGYLVCMKPKERYRVLICEDSQ